ncbi:amidohydrolase family protein [Rhodohalobacter sp.]|uniref:amidohydrolase family protein n=1 Tax=Rhodohalobacter sp. TaxID=1974210 RepID=UPI003A0FBF0B
MDGVSDEPRAEVSILISDNKITGIEDGFVSGSDNTQIIDLSNKTVLPGLIDLHVHLESETNPKKYMEQFTFDEADFAFRSTAYAKRTLMAGFTTVRELGGWGVEIPPSVMPSTRDLWTGPRVISVGKSIATTGGHADPTNGWKQDLMGNPGPREGVINGEDEARQAVRQRYQDRSRSVLRSPQPVVFCRVLPNREMPRNFSWMK